MACHQATLLEMTLPQCWRRHQELGPDYEQALIDGLVTRISQAIDERVDGHLAGSERPKSPCRAGQSPAVAITRSSFLRWGRSVLLFR